MRFFYLVKQDHGIGPPPDGFGQLPAFLVTHISGRRAHQARDRVLFHILGHIYTYQRRLGIKQEFGQCLSQFGLAYAGRPDEDK